MNWTLGSACSVGAGTRYRVPTQPKEEEEKVLAGTGTDMRCTSLHQLLSPRRLPSSLLFHVPLIRAHFHPLARPCLVVHSHHPYLAPPVGLHRFACVRDFARPHLGPDLINRMQFTVESSSELGSKTYWSIRISVSQSMQDCVCTYIRTDIPPFVRGEC